MYFPNHVFPSRCSYSRFQLPSQYAAPLTTPACACFGSSLYFGLLFIPPCEVYWTWDAVLLICLAYFCFGSVGLNCLCLSKVSIPQPTLVVCLLGSEDCPNSLPRLPLSQLHFLPPNICFYIKFSPSLPTVALYPDYRWPLQVVYPAFLGLNDSIVPPTIGICLLHYLRISKGRPRICRPP